MAVPESVKLDRLIIEAEALKFKFEYSIQPHNLEAFFKMQFFELSPRELREIPNFSDFKSKIQLFGLVSDCIIEVNENIFRFIETDEHVKRYLNGVLIKIENLNRQLSCFFLGNLSEYDKKAGLGGEKMVSTYERLAYMDRINLPKDPNAHLSAEVEFIGRNTHSNTLISDLHLAMRYVSSCNHIEVQYEKIRCHVNEQVEKHNPTSNQKKANKKTTNNTSNQTGLCVSESKIIDLYKLLNDEEIIYEIDCADFMKCFDLNNIPQNKPVFIPYNQIKMVYALSLIKNKNKTKSIINDEIAVNNFGFKPNVFKSQKSYLKKNNTIDFILKRKIEKIINE